MIAPYRKFREFLADHTPLQYPNVSIVKDRVFYQFRYEMPWHARALLVIVSLVIAVFGVALLAAFLFVVYLLIWP